MKTKITWKYKIIILAISSAILLWLLYSFGIKKSLQLYKDYTNLIQTHQTATQLDKQIGIAKEKIAREKEDAGSDRIKEFKTLPEFFLSLSHSKEVVISSLPTEKIIQIADEEVIHHTYQFSGDFTNLLLLLDSAEHTKGINMINARFSIDSRQTIRSPELYLTIETITSKPRKL